MPDWRNAEDYAFTDDLSPEGWAWEYLRRNPAYKEDYRALTKFLQELERQHGQLNDPTVRRSLRDIPNAYYFEPPRNENESISDWRERCLRADVEPTRPFVTVWKGWRWGIDGPIPDPFTEESIEPRFITTQKWPKIVTLEECSEYFADEGFEPDYPLVLVGFNLNLALKEQAESIKDKLADTKTRLIREGVLTGPIHIFQKSLWPDNLRILDADESGASSSEVGECLFNHVSDDVRRTNTVYERREVANRFRDRDYRLIPLGKPKS